jgi:hypothetical protein
MSSIHITAQQICDMNNKLQEMLETNKVMLEILSTSGPANKGNLLTAAEAATMVGVGYQYFMNIYRKVHKIPEVRKGKLVYFYAKDILDTKKQLQ